MTASTEDLLIQLTKRLLDAIAAGDWQTYADLCDPTLTCFEPEARGHLVEGMPFHQFYFELATPRGPRTTTISSPRVRVLGEAAVVAYVRLIQGLGGDGQPFTAAYCETRIWQQQNGRWKHVHFHRSEQPRL
jgi:calcium/calmodulin-dependent protein kinase (CaM kinase) II